LWTVRDAVIVEQFKKPVVAAITDEFKVHGENIARMEGHADLKRLILPYPLEGLPEAELREIAEQWYPKFLDMIGAQR
jgi:hypothetical protein